MRSMSLKLWAVAVGMSAWLLAGSELPDGRCIVRWVPLPKTELAASYLRGLDISFERDQFGQLIVAKADYPTVKEILRAKRFLEPEEVIGCKYPAIADPVLIDLVEVEHLDQAVALLKNWKIAFVRRGNDLIVDKADYEKVMLKFESSFWLTEGEGCDIFIIRESNDDPILVLTGSSLKDDERIFEAFYYLTNYVYKTEIERDEIMRYILRKAQLNEVRVGFLPPDLIIIQAVSPANYVWAVDVKAEIERECLHDLESWSRRKDKALQVEFR